MILFLFNRPIDITKHLKAHPNLTIDEDNELIIDMPEAVTDIAVRNCSGRFNMLYCNESQTPADELRSMVSKDEMYVCRYKIIKLNGKYCLLPWTVSVADASKAAQNMAVANAQNKENTPHKTDTNKRKITVTPIKIINNSVQKVKPRSRCTSKYAHQTTPLQSDAAGQAATNDGNDSDTLTPRKRSRQYGDVHHHNNNNTPKPSACKNLNVSMIHDGSGDNDLNYSIEQQDHLKVKIKISDRQRYFLLLNL